MADEWTWLTDRNSPVRSAFNLFVNILLVGMIVYALMDFNGFKQSVECKSWQPVIDVAKTCLYGVRADLCWVQPWQNYSYDILNKEQANLTDYMNPTPLKTKVVENGSVV